MADALAQNVQLASMLASLSDKVFGSESEVTKKTSGGTTSKQTQLSPDAVNYLLKGLMEKTDGLASVAGAQKVPGLYNSTTRDLMVNDLLARSAGEVAVAGAPTVTTETPTTSTQKTSTPGLLGSSGLGTAALIGGGLLLNSDKGKELLSGIGETLGIGGTASTGTAAAASKFSEPLLDLLDSSSTSMTAAADAGQDIAIDLFSGYDGATDPSIVSGSAFMDSSSGFDFGMPSPMSAFNFLTGNNAGGAAGESLTLSMVPVVGPYLSMLNSGMLNNIPVIGDIAENVVQPAVDVVGDVAKGVGDWVTEDVPDAVDFIGESIGDMCFITTAACEYHGKDDDCYELTTLRQYRDSWLKENHPEDIKQYYNEAPAIVQKLKTREDAAVIFKAFYSDYIVPSVEAIQDGANEIAYTVYKNLFNVASELAAETKE